MASRLPVNGGGEGTNGGKSLTFPNEKNKHISSWEGTPVNVSRVGQCGVKIRDEKKKEDGGPIFENFASRRGASKSKRGKKND